MTFEMLITSMAVFSLSVCQMVQSNCYILELVGRGIETHLQVGNKLNLRMRNKLNL